MLRGDEKEKEEGGRGGRWIPCDDIEAQDIEFETRVGGRNEVVDQTHVAQVNALGMEEFRKV